MIFYEKATMLALMVLFIPAILSAYLHLVKSEKRSAILVLVLTGLLFRLLMITIDPYLHEWDERFHALVAKHMIVQPFKPMLFLKHILPYNLHDWAYMEVWVHKQPLFLWQMAFSMEIFGVNLIGLRLPSAIMGAIMIWLTYDLARKWLKNDNVAFIAAFISSLSYYILELTSGLMSLEHNDLAFTFYMTCCFWAFTRYVHSSYHVKWAILIGVFAGLAILNKWLVGLLIFGGWGLYLLQNKFDAKKYVHITLAVIVSCIVFVPWQLYIQHEFPEQSAIAYEYNRKHMTDDLGHPGTALFHITYLPVAYHIVLVVFLLIGILFALIKKSGDVKMTISFLAMIMVIYSFFSFFVPAKMPAFVFPVSSLMFGLIALGVFTTCGWLISQLRDPEKAGSGVLLVVTLAIGLMALKPWQIARDRFVENHYRNNKIYNNKLFREFDADAYEGYVIINTRDYENIELMFYKDVLAYHWYPQAHQIDSLQNIGYKFAAFQFQGDQHQLPDYIVNDTAVLILPHDIK